MRLVVPRCSGLQRVVPCCIMAQSVATHRRVDAVDRRCQRWCEFVRAHRLSARPACVATIYNVMQQRTLGCNNSHCSTCCRRGAPAVSDNHDNHGQHVATICNVAATMCSAVRQCTLCMLHFVATRSAVMQPVGLSMGCRVQRTRLWAAPSQLRQANRIKPAGPGADATAARPGLAQMWQG